MTPTPESPITPEELRKLADSNLTNAAGIDRVKVKELREALRQAADALERLRKEQIRDCLLFHEVERERDEARDLLTAKNIKMGKLNDELYEARSILKKASKAAHEVLEYFVEQADERGEEGVPVVLSNLVWLAAGHKAEGGEGVG